MNSVSSPSRPACVARAAMAATSGRSKCLLPAFGLPGRPHADGLVQPERAPVAPVHAQLGVCEAGAAERVEQPEQQRAPVAAPASARGNGELGGVAGAALPALAEPGADEPLVVVEQQPQRRVVALLADRPGAPLVQRL